MEERFTERARQLALFMLENDATVRTAAKHFHISKSTVHKDITQKLPQIDLPLYAQVRHLLEANKAARHIRGGLATQAKYRQKKAKA